MPKATTKCTNAHRDWLVWRCEGHVGGRLERCAARSAALRREKQKPSAAFLLVRGYLWPGGRGRTAGLPLFRRTRDDGEGLCSQVSPLLTYVNVCWCSARLSG